MKVTVHYNSPVVLTFALVASALVVVNGLTVGALTPFFSVGPGMDVARPLDWFRLFSHVLGHAGISHLLGNMMLLLLLGPILEEKYGSAKLAAMFAGTAAVTGLLHVALFGGALLGASGIVFMLILLSSVTNVRSGKVPLTFILVVVLYLGQEVASALKPDGISQFAHIVGGLCGAAFGWVPVMVKQRSRKAKPEASAD